MNELPNDLKKLREKYETLYTNYRKLYAKYYYLQNRDKIKSKMAEKYKTDKRQEELKHKYDATKKTIVVRFD